MGSTSAATPLEFGIIDGTGGRYTYRIPTDVSATTGDVLMTAYDPATGNIWYGKNGSWLTGDPATGSTPTFTLTAISGANFGVCTGTMTSGTTTVGVNFGQRPFSYTPPTGYVALNSYNLPTPAIIKGDTVMNATIYTGSSSTNAIVNSGAVRPDLVWVKNRQQNYPHYIYDSIRGTGATALSSNSTAVEGSDGTSITSFNSNGFTFTGNSGANDPTYANAYIGWQWSAGGTYDVLQSYTTAGSYTYTVPAGVSTLRVVVIGGGGASGGSGAGAGTGGNGGNSSFGTVTGNGGSGGGAGPNTPGAGGSGGTGSGGDGGITGAVGETGTGSGVTSRVSTGPYNGYGDSAGHYGWGGGGGGGGTRYATLSVSAGQTYSVTVGAAGVASGTGAGGGGGPGFDGAVLIYGSTDWPANGSGSISSLVNAGSTQGFSVVTFTTPSSNTTSTVGHGLSVAPSLIIVKCLSVAASWYVYHASLGATQSIFLNNNNSADTSQKFWNNTAPTSSVFTIMQNGVAWWDLNATHVAYCFSSVNGYSAFGNYTGNGSTDGPFVYTGFKPKFIMLKDATTSGRNWITIDSARSPYNPEDAVLLPNAIDTEASGGGYYLIDMLSNGFKLRTSWVGLNGSSENYIYAAFAENPFKYALAR